MILLELVDYFELLLRSPNPALLTPRLQNRPTIRKVEKDSKKNLTKLNTAQM